MSQRELRYDERVESMMKSINESSNEYLVEGVKAESPAIGALRFHRQDAGGGAVIQSSAWQLAQSHLPDGLGAESEKLGDYTVEVKVYEESR